MARLENTFSWSFSRARTFEDCPRKYWAHYYGSWGGWQADADPEARELYRLKNLTNLHMLAGDVVHRAIERALTAHSAGHAADPEEVVGWCKREMQRGLSESQRELWHDQPKRFVRLFEHHYGWNTADPQALLERIAFKVGTSVRTFFESPAFGVIRESDPAAWLPMETLDSFRFEGTKVFAVPDFACRHRGEVLLFDWKTGRPDRRNKDQVALYALFAAAKWGADPDCVRGAPVYLLDGGRFDPVPVDAADRERVAQRMRSSIAAMKDRLEDPATNKSRREDFEATPGRVCRSCNFRGACPHAQ